MSAINRCVNIPRNLVMALLGFYRKMLSPLKLQCCRFYPSCSEYAIGSLERHGFIKGAVLAIKRIFRCHPFSSGGYDPVK